MPEARRKSHSYACTRYPDELASAGCYLTLCLCSQADDFLHTLGGRGKEGGQRWRLVFNAGSRQPGSGVPCPKCDEDRLLL